MKKKKKILQLCPDAIDWTTTKIHISEIRPLSDTVKRRHCLTEMCVLISCVKKGAKRDALKRLETALPKSGSSVSIGCSYKPYILYNAELVQSDVEYVPCEEMVFAVVCAAHGEDNTFKAHSRHIYAHTTLGVHTAWLEPAQVHLFLLVCYIANGL